jgi:hypothetical protein
MAECGETSVSLERLQQILPAAYDKYQLLVPALDLMVHYRVETISLLNEVAEDLQKRRRGGNLVKVAGSATGVVGSGMAAGGLALTPFTFGFGLLFMAGGAAVAGLGAATTVGAHVTEKVCERVDLEKVQQAIDRDKRQCECVKDLWKEFESYCDDAINTIALADPSKESDIGSIQTWTQVAMEELVHPIVFIAETIETAMAGAKNILGNQTGGNLCSVLGKVATQIITDPKRALCSVVSKLKITLARNCGTVAFLLISGVFLGNVIVLLFTLIDLHKGSPSKIAQDLRENSSKLEKELNSWLDAFGKPRRN